MQRSEQQYFASFSLQLSSVSTEKRKLQHFHILITSVLVNLQRCSRFYFDFFLFSAFFWAKAFGCVQPSPAPGLR
jgi:hypothetical protein